MSDQTPISRRVQGEQCRGAHWCTMQCRNTSCILCRWEINVVDVSSLHNAVFDIVLELPWIALHLLSSFLIQWVIRIGILQHDLVTGVYSFRTAPCACSMCIMLFLNNLSKALSPMHTCILEKACRCKLYMMISRRGQREKEQHIQDAKV